MKKYFVSCEKFTDTVKVDDNNIILDVIYVFSKFKGQKLENLTCWLEKKFGYVILRRIK